MDIMNTDFATTQVFPLQRHNVTYNLAVAQLFVAPTNFHLFFFEQPAQQYFSYDKKGGDPAITMVIFQSRKEISARYIATDLFKVLSTLGGMRVTLIVAWSIILLPYQLFALDISLIKRTYYEDLREAPEADDPALDISAR